MPRIEQEKARKGSQRWLQEAVTRQPTELAAVLLAALPKCRGRELTWLSPRADDDYAEYSDSSALDLAGLRDLPHRPLKEFWPARGPVWDGIARSEKGDVILIEAKAHIPEMVSPATGARGASLALIERSLRETRKALGSNSPNTWTGTFYQYANRLAFLHLLRDLNKLPVHLAFLYFTHAPDLPDAPGEAEWHGAIEIVHAYLGLGRHRLSPYVGDAFFDANDVSRSRHAAGGLS